MSLLPVLRTISIKRFVLRLNLSPSPARAPRMHSTARWAHPARSLICRPSSRRHHKFIRRRWRREPARSGRPRRCRRTRDSRA
eukprot:6390122-Prymnesium_polylepis.1